MITFDLYFIEIEFVLFVQLVINPVETGHTPACVRRYEPTDNFTVHVIPNKHFLQDFLVILNC